MTSALASYPVPALTQALARHGAQSRFEDLPEVVRQEAARALLNWVGCGLGGCREPAVDIAAVTVAELGGAPHASLFGRSQRTDVASAAFVNCIASSVMAFDDAHLATVTHPSGPVGAALLAFSERQPVRGTDFLNAFALGIEIQCRLSNMLVLAPARFNAGFYITGLTGPVGAAVAVGRLMGLDAQHLNWAIGLAASQASGFRSAHGTMTAHFRPGHAARSGVWAALLAARGFTGDEACLEAEKGFADVFSQGVDPSRALVGLGEQHELLRNAYKPYPCGIVIHPTLDACLDLHARMPPQARPVALSLRVHPLAMSMCGIRTPVDTLESHVSLYHWAAAALVQGQAGLPQMRMPCITDPEVAGLRERIQAVADPELGRDQAWAEVRLSDGQVLQAQVLQSRGSAARPMTDAELDAKFTSQASPILGEGQVAHLRDLCRSVSQLGDVGRELMAVMQPARG